jgi:transcriptional regulator with XRE-family HTH domain
MPEKESWRFIGQRIRVLRKSNQLTIKQLANGCGLSSNAISLVERGEVAPTVSTLCKIANAMGTTVATFFDEACPGDDDWHISSQHQQDKATMGCALVTPDDQPAGRPEPGSGCSTGKALPSILCVCGQLEYAQGDQCHRLGPGEAVLVDHTRPHVMRNTGKETGIALLVFPASSSQPSQAEN